MTEIVKVLPITPSGVTVINPIAGSEYFVEVYAFTYSGDLAPYVGQGRLYLDTPGEIRSVRFSLGTPPVGSACVFDVRKNGGTSILNAPVSVPVGGYTVPVTTGFADTSVVRGDYLTVNINSVGLTVPGADLTVTIRVKRLS